MTNATVIFLNGTSSSGKSTLAQALQAGLADHVFLHVAEDMFFNMLPAHAYQHADFFRYGSQLYSGFAYSVAALAGSGSRVIVDTVAWSPGSLEAFLHALQTTPTLAVGVHCDLEVLEERERKRGDRSAGLARRQYNLAHQDMLYDVEVDTSRQSLDVSVAVIVNAWCHPSPGVSAFNRMQARTRGANAR
jgi:chloramphenicol 3-O phosphotransferase